MAKKKTVMFPRPGNKNTNQAAHDGVLKYVRYPPTFRSAELFHGLRLIRAIYGLPRDQVAGFQPSRLIWNRVEQLMNKR